jgi:hypothetical protein
MSAILEIVEAGEKYPNTGGLAGQLKRSNFSSFRASDFRDGPIPGHFVTGILTLAFCAARGHIVAVR